MMVLITTHDKRSVVVKPNVAIPIVQIKTPLYLNRGAFSI
ncbi:protein of unknown function [Vibrio tapetis subsp. tapetis]|uniref:Uncharacterized protein n=1 Tax=Vibrio tapetis subsp. tapetis TaxID=1671868 RepID=A0A2N8Z9U5_9VIBR|nr:protein of unknown function [Vibrio tapetis subsp. tapetis]